MSMDQQEAEVEASRIVHLIWRNVELRAAVRLLQAAGLNHAAREMERIIDDERPSDHAFSDLVQHLLKRDS